jgi:hypothetical protein
MRPTRGSSGQVHQRICRQKRRIGPRFPASSTDVYCHREVSQKDAVHRLREDFPDSPFLPVRKLSAHRDAIRGTAGGPSLVQHAESAAIHLIPLLTPQLYRCTNNHPISNFVGESREIRLWSDLEFRPEFRPGEAPLAASRSVPRALAALESSKVDAFRYSGAWATDREACVAGRQPEVLSRAPPSAPCAFRHSLWRESPL